MKATLTIIDHKILATIALLAIVSLEAFHSFVGNPPWDGSQKWISKISYLLVVSLIFAIAGLWLPNERLKGAFVIGTILAFGWGLFLEITGSSDSSLTYIALSTIAAIHSGCAKRNVN